MASKLLSISPVINLSIDAHVRCGPAGLVWIGLESVISDMHKFVEFYRPIFMSCTGSNVILWPSPQRPLLPPHTTHAHTRTRTHTHTHTPSATYPALLRLQLLDVGRNRLHQWEALGPLQHMSRLSNLNLQGNRVCSVEGYTAKVRACLYLEPPMCLCVLYTSHTSRYLGV